MNCGKTFTNKKRIHTDKLIRKYLLDKQIYRVLAKQQIPYKKIQKAIDTLDFKYPKLAPRSCTVAIDTTYFGRKFGVTIFRDVTNRVVLHWVFVQNENIKAHIDGINYLVKHEIVILGFVVDGFWSFYTHYRTKYDIQMCQKHMADRIRRATTLNPRLTASKELKQIADRLSGLNKHEFLLKYNTWLKKWKEFLDEKTYSRTEKRWIYTHERVKQAIRSINRYLPYLFTFERNHWLPNTNNSIEGFNSGLKSAIKPHKGLRNDRKAKLIHCYLREKSEFKWR